MDFLQFAAQTATITDVIVLSIIAAGMFVAWLTYTTMSVQCAFARSEATTAEDEMEIALD